MSDFDDEDHPYWFAAFLVVATILFICVSFIYFP